MSFRAFYTWLALGCNRFVAGINPWLVADGPMPSVCMCYPQVVVQEVQWVGPDLLHETLTWTSVFSVLFPLWNEFLARAWSAGYVFAQQFSFLWKHGALSKVPLCPSAALPGWALPQVWTWMVKAWAVVFAPWQGKGCQLSSCFNKVLRS